MVFGKFIGLPSLAVAATLVCTAAVRLAVAVQGAHAPEHVVIVRADALIEHGAVTRKAPTTFIEIGHAHSLALCTAGARTSRISRGTAADAPKISLRAQAIPGKPSERLAFVAAQPCDAPLGNRLGTACAAAIVSAVVIALRQAARNFVANFTFLARAVLGAGLAVFNVFGFALAVAAYSGDAADARLEIRAGHVAEGAVLSLGCPEALFTLLAVLHRPAGRVLGRWDATPSGVKPSPILNREGLT